MNKNIHNIDWSFITETIRNEKCILFIGGELFRDENNLTLEDQLFDYLNVNTNPDIQNFYKKDGLFLFTSGTKKTKSYYKIKQFYNQKFPILNDILDKLTLIPFHFIISITPDKKCYDRLKKHGFNSRFDFYWKKNKAKNINIPTIKNPVIYNMFGSVERQDSMILTHDDLFDYFESIFQENSMPEKLKLNLREAHNFIFLGLDFEKWYMQILLRILYLHNDKFEFMRYAANQKMSKELKAFCFEQFKIEFVPTQIKEFVDNLYFECKKVGLLRNIEKKQSSIIRNLKKLLAQDRISEVFKAFKHFLENLGDTGQELLDDTFVLSSRFRRLKRKINLGIIDTRDIETENNKIRLSLIELFK